MLDVLALGLLHDQVGRCDPVVDEETLRVRISKAYQRAQIMLDVRKQFI